MELGLTPSEEDCPQVGEDDYTSDAFSCALRYIGMLENRFPWANKNGIVFLLKAFSHDFGTYHEVVAMHPEDKIELALLIQNNLPEYWSDNSIMEEQ